MCKRRNMQTCRYTFDSHIQAFLSAASSPRLVQYFFVLRYYYSTTTQRSLTHSLTLPDLCISLVYFSVILFFSSLTHFSNIFSPLFCVRRLNPIHRRDNFCCVNIFSSLKFHLDQNKSEKKGLYREHSLMLKKKKEIIILRSVRV